jgi:viroplasmin and RNaseH domain-containing protein
VKFRSLEEAEDWMELVTAALSGGQTESQAMGTADHVCHEYRRRVDLLKEELTQKPRPMRVR